MNLFSLLLFPEFHLPAIDLPSFKEFMEVIFSFVLSHMRPIELFVFWYPIAMGMLWMIGGTIYYHRIEKKKPLPLVSTPMVSVLVPAYNEGDNIINTVEKLRLLDYPNYEIIVINDGSSDESPLIERQLAHKYDNVRFIDLKENCGKANALYLGFIASKGEFLVCVDGDSYLAPDCLNYIIPHFTTPNNGERVGAVTGNPRVRNRSSLLSRIQICEYASIISLIKRTQRIWGKVMTVSGVVVAFRKQALLDSGLWDRDMITEDIAVTWKLEKNFWDVRYEPRAICWMLVPESLKGLAKQRKRWAQGGQEVMFRHFSIFGSWRRRRMIPIYLEQVVSLIWVIAWFLLTITELFKLFYDVNSYIPYLWKSQYISIICLLQFFVAMGLDHKYDKDIFKNAITAAWYPVIYWVVSGLVALWALPGSLGRRKKLATWVSPDRGIDTADEAAAKEAAAMAALERAGEVESEHLVPGETLTRIDRYAPQPEIPEDQIIKKMPDRPKEKADDDVIHGKQKLWKKVIEYIVTIFCWAYILIYILYMTYGLICLATGNTPASIWIYNLDVMRETGHIVYITMIIFLIELATLILWKEYNRFRFSHKDRRTFRAGVTKSEISRLFTLTYKEVDFYQNEKIITLEKNIIPEDFRAIRPWKKGEFDYIDEQNLELNSEAAD